MTLLCYDRDDYDYIGDDDDGNDGNDDDEDDEDMLLFLLL